MSPGKTRTCPHCKATILESATVCPGCQHHLRFDPDAQRMVPAATPLTVEGTVRHPKGAEPWEYSIVLSVRNGRGEEITRQVVGVGVLAPDDVRSFSLAVEMFAPQTLQRDVRIDQRDMPPARRDPTQPAVHRSPFRDPRDPRTRIPQPGVDSGRRRAAAAAARSAPARAADAGAHPAGRRAAPEGSAQAVMIGRAGPVRWPVIPCATACTRFQSTDLPRPTRTAFRPCKGIDLEVEQGDFFALLGPNGAGKTTLIGIITSLVTKIRRYRAGVRPRHRPRAGGRQVLHRRRAAGDQLQHVRVAADHRRQSGRLLWHRPRRRAASAPRSI